MRILWIGLLFICFTGFGQFEIGQKAVVFIDAERDREVETFIFYPANEAGEDVAHAAGEFPVIAVGHGFVMSYDYYTYLWEYFVPLGYIVVLPNTETTIEVSHGNYGDDLSFVIHAVQNEGALESSLFYNHVTSKSAVIGHSMGGGAAVLAAAADPEITTLITLAAAETDPSAIAAASEVSQPSLTFAGGVDCVTPPEAHQELIYTNLSDCKAYAFLPGGSHCQFAESNFLCEFGEFSCTDATLSEDEQHATVLAIMAPWLKAYLKNDFPAWAEFEALEGTYDNYNLELNCDDNGPSLALNVFPKSTLILMPNPTSNGVKIPLDYQNLEYSVYTVEGRLVQSGITTHQLDLVNLDPGFYLVKLNNGDGNWAVSRIQKL